MKDIGKQHKYQIFKSTIINQFIQYIIHYIENYIITKEADKYK
jgi:hypothetical protein